MSRLGPATGKHRGKRVTIVRLVVFRKFGPAAFVYPHGGGRPYYAHLEEITDIKHIERARREK